MAAMMREDWLVETRQIIDRTIFGRRVTMGVFCAIALVVVLSSEISPLNPLFVVPFTWLALTVPFQVLIHRQRRLRTMNNVHAAFLSLETLFVAYLIHRTGGVGWIGVVFLIFTILYANFFLPRAAGYVVTGLAVGTYALVSFLEYFGVIPHYSLFLSAGPPHRYLPYVVTTVLVGGVGIYSVLAFTVRSFTEIYRNKARALGSKEAQLARLSKRLLSVQDEERRRIAQELHDRLGQSLTAIKLHLATLKGGLNHEKEEEIMGIIDNTIEQTRTLAYSLRPPLLDNLGLNPSLYRLAEMVKSESGLEVNLSLEEGKRLPTAIEGLLFYVTQEALKNTATHARARQVNINLLRPPGSVILSIEDDGIGFRPKERQGLGIAGIKQRVEMSGGKIQIRSSPGNGTMIKVQIPHGHNSSRNR